MLVISIPGDERAGDVGVTLGETWQRARLPRSQSVALALWELGFSAWAHHWETLLLRTPSLLSMPSGIQSFTAISRGPGPILGALSVLSTLCGPSERVGHFTRSFAEFFLFFV